MQEQNSPTESFFWKNFLVRKYSNVASFVFHASRDGQQRRHIHCTSNYLSNKEILVLQNGRKYSILFIVCRCSLVVKHCLGKTETVSPILTNGSRLAETPM